MMNADQFRSFLEESEESSPYRRLMKVDVAELTDNDGDGPGSTVTEGSGWWPWLK